MTDTTIKVVVEFEIADGERITETAIRADLEKRLKASYKTRTPFWMASFTTRHFNQTVRWMQSTAKKGRRAIKTPSKMTDRTIRE